MLLHQQADVHQRRQKLHPAQPQVPPIRLALDAPLVEDRVHVQPLELVPPADGLEGGARAPNHRAAGVGPAATAVSDDTAT